MSPHVFGAGRATGYALGTWPGPVIPRDMLCEVVDAAGPFPQLSMRVKRTLRRYREEGLVTFTVDAVTILDPRECRRRSLYGIDTAAALEQVRAIEDRTRMVLRRLPARRAAALEAIERERRQIEQLMAGPYGPSGTGRRVLGAGRPS